MRFVPGLGERKAIALKQSLPKLAKANSDTYAGNGSNPSWQDDEEGDALNSNSYLKSRSILLYDNGGPFKANVYTNAAGYLRIGSIDPYSQTQAIQVDYGGDSERKFPEPLDVTRIHPEDYADAKLLADGDITKAEVIEEVRALAISMLPPNGTGRDKPEVIDDGLSLLILLASLAFFRLV